MKRKVLWNTLGIIAAIPMIMSGCGKESESERGLRTQDEKDIPEETDETEVKPTEETEPQSGNETVKEPEEKDTEPDVDYEKIYEPVIAEIEEVYQNGYDFDRDYEYFPMGLMEKVMYEDTKDLLNYTGYAIMDINGDNVPELLIGENAFSEKGEKSIFYGGYSIVDGNLNCFLDGYTRSSYEWIGDGKFFYFGSNGAMSSLFGQCYLSKDGKELLWDDFYFSDEVNGKSVYYHNNSGITDPDQSEELKMSGSDFWNMMEDYKTTTISFDSFSGVTNSVSAKQDITGSWYLRSYVDRKVVGYQFFSDGTWLAAIMSYPEMRPEDNLLAGTWEKSGSEYKIFDNNYDLIYQGKISSDEYGDRTLDFGTIEFYESENAADINNELADYIGTWLYPNGAALELAKNGSWTLYDDEGNWLFGGHWILNDGPAPIQLRLHSAVGDAGNNEVAEAILDQDESGYNTMELQFETYLTDFTGGGNNSGVILYKSVQ
ncbi:MAG: hypothetical protein IKN07_04710 [Lachnospiraceae bacterium]|nr:hypothetical protein [Lachnospiraceae bacterium]